MKLRIRLAVLFYEVMILLFVSFLALFVTHRISLTTINQILEIIYADWNMRLLFGTIAVILFFKTYIMGRMIYGVHEKERNIAFDNPAGRVYVTLTAMEDLIRRTLARQDEVKESRVTLLAKKGGDLHVGTRLTLNVDCNIPEMTSKIQELIQNKIEKTIGSEHKIFVEVDVVKILTREKSPVKAKKGADETGEQESNVPFEGYRA